MSTVLEVVGISGTHIVECLASGGMGRLVWVPREKEVVTNEEIPNRLSIYNGRVNPITCPEFMCLLTLGDVEILLSVFCDRFEDVERFAHQRFISAPGDPCAAQKQRDGPDPFMVVRFAALARFQDGNRSVADIVVQ